MDGTARILRDYSSMELTVSPGEVVTGFETVEGWIRCRNANGDEGWVPEENCSPLA
jgi:SH3-like domain-containing protein